MSHGVQYKLCDQTLQFFPCGLGLTTIISAIKHTKEEYEKTIVQAFSVVNCWHFILPQK